MDSDRSAQDMMNDAVQWLVETDIAISGDTLRFIADVSISIRALDKPNWETHASS